MTGSVTTNAPVLSIVPVVPLSPQSKPTAIPDWNVAAQRLYTTLVEAKFRPSTIGIIADELARQAILGQDQAKATMISPFLYLTAHTVYHELETKKYESAAINNIAQSLKVLSS